MSPGRHAQPGGAPHRWNLDLRAKRRFVHGDGHHQVEIVALPPEQRMRGHVHGDVEIARRCAQPPRVATAGDAHSRLVLNTDLIPGSARKPGRKPCARAPSGRCRCHHTPDTASSRSRRRPYRRTRDMNPAGPPAHGTRPRPPPDRRSATARRAGPRRAPGPSGGPSPRGRLPQTDRQTWTADSHGRRTRSRTPRTPMDPSPRTAVRSPPGRIAGVDRDRSGWSTPRQSRGSGSLPGRPPDSRQGGTGARAAGRPSSPPEATRSA